MSDHPICDYEGSEYQQVFWDSGDRAYEDLCEANALKRLLPTHGRLLLELGAGAGRNTPRYRGFERIVLLDYSRTQLQQARTRLGDSDRYIYVAANIYALPFIPSLFDAATMIRTLHHMVNPLAALQETSRVLEPQGRLILEYANKRNLKAILRYLVKKQPWNPFSWELVEYTRLNYNFHPMAVEEWLATCHFQILNRITVSHFRIGLLKRIVSPRLLAFVDSIFGRSGNLLQLSPSVFILAKSNVLGMTKGTGFFRCPACGSSHLADTTVSNNRFLKCSGCLLCYPVRDGIFDFKEPALP
jgi:ubiquinone/menaquinone biosynthesis C-methylase UbiE